MTVLVAHPVSTVYQVIETSRYLFCQLWQSCMHVLLKRDGRLLLLCRGLQRVSPEITYPLILDHNDSLLIYRAASLFRMTID